jgi:hypothetical protein
MTPNRILNLNALSTAGCAISMLFTRGTLYTLFGLDGPLLLDAIAVGLIAYAVALALAARQPSVSRPTLLTFAVMDDAWVIASVVVLSMFWSELAPFGRVLTIAVALVVGGFALLQYRAAGWTDARQRTFA